MAGEDQLAFNHYPEEDPETGERWVRTPREHGRLVHGGGKGLVAIAEREPDDIWREHPHPVEVAIELLNHYWSREEVFLSTQRFKGRRRIAHLLSLGALFADLDFYQVPELKHTNVRSVLKLALSALAGAGLPEPTIAITSGRGLYLLWLHSPIPRGALPRWTACQRQLWEVLAPLGADRQALDAARVLRVIGTRHRQAQLPVEALTPVGEIRNFETLAKEILPIERSKLYDLRVQRALRSTRKDQERLVRPPEGFTKATLWEARLSDLQRLRELRWFGEPLPDFRDRWLFLAGVAMSWLAIPSVLRRELYALAEEVGGWSEGRARSKLHAVFRTAEEAAQGKKVQWEGLEIDPRYRLKNQTIIDILKITPEEEREMKTIISDEERRRRHREKERRRKRDAQEVKMSRQEYEGRAKMRRREVSKLRAEGLSVRKIAADLGISERRVKQLLKEIREDRG